MREYGARRAENLWESYERQVNRMKTFSLQHRLKLMRQYKVKQRYLNKLLDSLNQDQHDPADLISKQVRNLPMLFCISIVQWISIRKRRCWRRWASRSIP